MSFPRPITPLLKSAALAAALLAFGYAEAGAQGAFPAPLPNGATAAKPANASPFPPVNSAPATGTPASGAASSSPFPPVNGAPASQTAFPATGAAPVTGMGGGFAAPPPQGDPGGPGGAGAACMTEFKPLRDETERRGKAIKAASDRKASAQEACGLIINFANAEAKLMKYIVDNQKRCGIPPEVPAQMKQGRANTERTQKQVCNAAKQQQAGPAPGPSLSETLGSVSLPEANTSKRSGGTTFDTLNGNVLAR